MKQDDDIKIIIYSTRNGKRCELEKSYTPLILPEEGWIPSEEEGPCIPCFIATAVYGNNSIEIQVLREFRDNVLKTSYIGNLAINLYYKISPPIARCISRNKGVSGGVRFCLDFLVKYLEHKNKRI